MVALSGVIGMMALTGCLSLQEQLDRQEAWVTRGDYVSAYDQAATLAEDASPDGADANFWQVDAGTLALMTGDLQGATKHLEAADQGFNDEGRRLIGAGAVDQSKAILTSDCLLNFAPEGNDRVFVNLYKALAYGGEQDLRSMRVELNRVRHRQNEWFYVCTKAIAQQEEELAALSRKEREAVLATVNRASSPSVGVLDLSVAAKTASESQDATRFFTRLRGYGNAYASHLTGVARWCMGDASRNDLLMAQALAPYNAFVKQDCALAEKGVPSGRVWIYVEDGLASKRVAKSMTLPYLSIASKGTAASTIHLEVPVLKSRQSAASLYTVNGVELNVLTDVDALVKDQFDRAWIGILTRQVARTLTRILAQEATQAAIRQRAKKQEQAGETAKARQTQSLAGIVGILFSLFDQAMSAADLRCGDLLPKWVWMGAIERPSNGQVTIVPRGSAATTVKLRSKGNAVLWVRKPSAAAPMKVIEIDLDWR